jgi:hypothetical protein
MALLAPTVVTNTDFDMKKKLVKTMLKQLHPEHQGWRQLPQCQLDDIDLNHVYYRKGSEPVAVLLMEHPYAVSDDMKLAQHIMTLYKERMNGRQIQLVLIYRELLIRPQCIPKGVRIMSLCEVSTEPQPFEMN